MCTKICFGLEYLFIYTTITGLSLYDVKKPKNFWFYSIQKHFFVQDN
jgi:hypothetical protein